MSLTGRTGSDKLQRAGERQGSRTILLEDGGRQLHGIAAACGELRRRSGLRTTFPLVISASNSEVYQDRLPTVAEFHDLFDSVGWRRYGAAPSAAALEGSLFGTVALADSEVVAMGRVVGDGGKFFYIQDLIVRPEYQGQGIGRQIVRRLMDAIERMAPGSPFVGVFATPEAVPLYRKLGLDGGFGGLTGMAGVRETGDIEDICVDRD